MTILKNDWNQAMEGEFEKPYYQRLRKILIEEYQTRSIYRDRYEIYNALHFTPYKETKVVILGQGPYPGFDGRT